jgi:hypothetical protein
MKTIYVTDPNGQKHKRTTRRTYTHVVMYRDSKAWAMEYANTKWTHFHSNFWYHKAYINGTSKWLERNAWENDEQHATRVKGDVERAEKANRGCATPDELWEIVRVEQVAAVMAKDFTKYEVAHWCGRHDLAVTQARKLSVPRHSDVVIVPVDPE